MVEREREYVHFCSMGENNRVMEAAKATKTSKSWRNESTSAGLTDKKLYPVQTFSQPLGQSGTVVAWLCTAMERDGA